MSNPRLLLGGRSQLASEWAKEFADQIRKAAEIRKAGAAQESTGRHTMPTEKQAKREYEHSFIRQPAGQSGDLTPDLPERGRDWHGTVEGVLDEDQSPASDLDDESEHEHTPGGGVQKVWENPTTPFQAEGSEQPPVENEEEQASAVKSLMASAMKAFAGAPRFAQGPLVPPREKDWLLRQGYSPEEVMSGQVQITPRMRGEFNRWLQGTIRKSLDGLLRR